MTLTLLIVNLLLGIWNLYVGTKGKLQLNLYCSVVNFCCVIVEAVLLHLKSL